MRWGQFGQRVAALVLAAALAVVAGAPPAGAHESRHGTEGEAAQRQREITEQLNDLQGHLDEATAEEALVLAEYRAVESRLAALEVEVDELDRAVASARADVGLAQGALDDAEQAYGEARAHYLTSRRHLTRARETLRSRAVAAYVGTTTVADMADAMLQVQSASDFTSSSTYLRSVLEAQHREVVDFKAAADADREVADALDAARDEAVARRDELAGRQAALQHARDDRAAAVDAVDVERARKAVLLERARASRASYEARVAELKAESDSIAEFLRRLRSTADFGGDGTLINPLPSGRLTSTYGYRTHPIYGTKRLHTGIDLAAPSGTPIIAAAAGEVVYAGWRGGYGNTVIIYHGSDLATLYAHQSSLAVSAGKVVAVGDTIGYVGSTGNSTGPHLHFEVRVSGNPVDPMPYL